MKSKSLELSLINTCFMSMYAFKSNILSHMLLISPPMSNVTLHGGVPSTAQFNFRRSFRRRRQGVDCSKAWEITKKINARNLPGELD